MAIAGDEQRRRNGNGSLGQRGAGGHRGRHEMPRLSREWAERRGTRMRAPDDEERRPPGEGGALDQPWCGFPAREVGPGWVSSPGGGERWGDRPRRPRTSGGFADLGDLALEELGSCCWKACTPRRS